MLIDISAWDLINQDTLDFFSGMQDKLATYWESYTADATALCATFMLLFFGLKSYKMMLGEDRLDLLPLFRPFALLLVIVYWSQFATMVAYPGKVIANKARAAYTDNITALNLKAESRRVLIDTALWRIITTSNQVKQTQVLSDNFVVRGAQEIASVVTDAAAAVTTKLFGSYALIKAEISFWAGKLLEFIAACLFQASLYLILFIQIVFSSILIIFGPFSFALSILPAFRDTYVTWIARYISVSLYSGIAYMVLNLVMAMLNYTMDQEISRLTFLEKPENTKEFMIWSAASPGLLGYYLVGLFLGAIALLTVPSISTWIVSTSGINSAVGTAGRAATAMASGGATAVKGMI